MARTSLFHYATIALVAATTFAANAEPDSSTKKDVFLAPHQPVFLAAGIISDDVGPDGLKRRGDGSVDDSRPDQAGDIDDDIGPDGLKRRGDGSIDNSQPDGLSGRERSKDFSKPEDSRDDSQMEHRRDSDRSGSHDNRPEQHEKIETVHRK